MKMTKLSGWQRFAAVLSTGFALLLAGCETTPAFQVSQPSSRDGTVESIVQDTVQSGNAAAATIGGAVIGGLLGNQIGGGRGQTAATVIGAGGGAFVGNQAAQRQTLVWRIGVRYDDGSLATIQQTTAPALRIGDRVRVTGNGIELLRQGPN
jgi:outer membrane lipoprotein SlyB